jgi:predicted nucleotidyltransferase
MKMMDLPFDSIRLVDICKKNDVNYVGLFGSMARGDVNRKSDIDLLVRFSGRKSLLALVHLERELCSAMGHKVDVLTEASISPYLKDNIKHDLKVLYET